MVATEKKTEILADLVRINKDCTSSLQQYIKEHPCSSKLVPLLQQLVNVERECLLELRKEVDTSFGDPANAVEHRGEIYQAWERRADNTPPSKEKEVCAFCERRIRELTLAYNRALQMTTALPENTVHMLRQHITRVKETFAMLLRVNKEYSDRTFVLSYR
jgi:hypothetical protein